MAKPPWCSRAPRTLQEGFSSFSPEKRQREPLGRDISRLDGGNWAGTSQQAANTLVITPGASSLEKHPPLHGPFGARGCWPQPLLPAPGARRTQIPALQPSLMLAPVSPCPRTQEELQGHCCRQQTRGSIVLPVQQSGQEAALPKKPSWPLACLIHPPPARPPGASATSFLHGWSRDLLERSSRALFCPQRSLLPSCFSQPPRRAPGAQRCPKAAPCPLRSAATALRNGSGRKTAKIGTKTPAPTTATHSLGPHSPKKPLLL